MSRPSSPPLGMPPAKGPGLIWRRARRTYVCDGDGSLRLHRDRAYAPECTTFIITGQAYLECGRGFIAPAASYPRRCEACARAFLAGCLDTRLESRAKKEPTHA